VIALHTHSSSVKYIESDVQEEFNISDSIYILYCQATQMALARGCCHHPCSSKETRFDWLYLRRLHLCGYMLHLLNTPTMINTGDARVECVCSWLKCQYVVLYIRFQLYNYNINWGHQVTNCPRTPSYLSKYFIYVYLRPIPYVPCLCWPVLHQY